MTPDTEAIRAHVEADDDGSGYYECRICLGNQTALLAEVERLARALDAAVVRVQAEADRHDRMREHAPWLRDILADLRDIQ